MSENEARSDARTEFDVRVDHLLQSTCEVARALVDSHQAAMAMLVDGDWTHARKYFSLSEKYADWARGLAAPRDQIDCQTLQPPVAVVAVAVWRPGVVRVAAGV